jgi:hypothetical protein
VEIKFSAWRSESKIVTNTNSVGRVTSRLTAFPHILESIAKVHLKTTERTTSKKELDRVIGKEQLKDISQDPMTSTNNKFSLLASLTSLPGDAPASDDDDILPSLAVEPVPEESAVVEKEYNSASSSELFKSAAETSGSQMNLGSCALLGSSGLFHQESFGGGSGLFDQIDEEEEAARHEEERRNYEEQERARLQEELRREKEAADGARILLLREEHERLEAEKSREEENRQQQLQQEQERLAFQQQQQQQQASYMNSGSVMGSMQDLSLNDDPMGYRPQAHQQNTGAGAGAVYSNVQNVQNQYSNVQNSQSMQPVQNQYPNVQDQYSNVQNQGPVQNQNGNQYSNAGVQEQYSNVQAPNPVQNGSQYNNVQQSSQSMQQSQQFQPPQPPQRQTTQETGYGGASYVYSTTGNVQQQVYQHPNGTGTAHSPNSNGMNQSTMSYQQPQMQPTLQSPPNAMPPTPMSPEASNSSYTLRSRMRQTSIHPMPNNAPPQPGSQQYLNGGLPMNGNHASNVQPYVPIYNPANFEPQLGSITVTDPILVQSPGMFAGPPHWTYAVVVRDMKKIEGQQEFSAVVSTVRRRFRHFVALEERLRADCKGAVLPPRCVIV